jgi:hypothetical protein
MECWSIEGDENIWPPCSRACKATVIDLMGRSDVWKIVRSRFGQNMNSFHWPVSRSRWIITFRNVRPLLSRIFTTSMA